jgi:hypothetical protein
MTIVLTESLFVNDEYSISFGLKTAKFSIVDEDYASGAFMASVNRMICVIQTFDTTGAKTDEVFGSLVVGLGDENMNVTSAIAANVGKLLTRENMADCLVELYE